MFNTTCSYIDAHTADYINNLKDAVAIKSVSAWPDHRPEITKMMKWAETQLKALGATSELRDIGTQVTFNLNVFTITSKLSMGQVRPWCFLCVNHLIIRVL